jgi:hypothetical protein
MQSVCQIVSRSGFVDVGLLGCNALRTCEKVQAFRINCLNLQASLELFLKFILESFISFRSSQKIRVKYELCC